ncbi:hypothetical protein [Streptomyces alfalfae]|uniref:Uncharacterized protein n=1 Tax=Streptomyces alfalfae TaxID=1642299 RepID=A0A7T4PGI7_9ACTN|nr:hypothetical protein [Streptomyces alfalfae]QQC89858.1 hypothetical protein I8755_16625 [Streptomyces alfalfae]
MTPSVRVLGWHYLSAAVLTAQCAAVTTRWYAIGLFMTSLLLVVAYAREHAAARGRRAAAVRAERIARLTIPRARVDDQAAIALAAACCERWWTSAGIEHDAACTRKGQTA